MEPKRWMCAGLVVAWIAGCSDSDPGADEAGDGTESSGTTDASGTSQTAGSGTSNQSTTAGSGGQTSEGSEGTSATNGQTTGSPADCPADALPPGTHTLQLEHDGMTREYQVYVPEGVASPAPLVLNFHGFTSNADQQTGFSGMNADADARGVIVVYPEGYMSSWNAGPCCGSAMNDDLDDVGFVRAMLDELPSLVCMDPSRVYATGMSNGGFLSHRLACEAADVIAAIGPVAGAMGLPPEECQPVRPVPIIHFHGTEDGLVPYEGSTLSGFPSIPEMSQQWADRNGCASASAVTLEMGDTLCETWSGCDDDVTVTLCTITGMGHCWPGTEFCPFGQSSVTISANAMMLDLFETHTL